MVKDVFGCIFWIIAIFSMIYAIYLVIKGIIDK
jgi:hypothetical protein